MTEPTIPGYSILERLGSGGFASVYRAVHDETATEWAIKVLHDHVAATDDLKRFERERTTMQALRHENIVSVNSHGQTEDGSHYTVLEYVGDGSVRDQIRDDGALHWSRAVSIGVQICGALDVAHRNGVLHRDVKPANILLDGTTAKLTDFGIARLVGQSAVTAAQSIIGTLAYTPPELFHNKPFDGRGDIYQLGVTLYEMLLGRAPFTSAAAENKATIIRRILDNPAPPLAQFDVPQVLSDLLDEALAKDPADRPQTAARFGERLNQVEVALGRSATPFAGAPTATISVFDDADGDLDDSGAVQADVDSNVEEIAKSAPPTAPDVPQFSIAEHDTQATVIEPLPDPTNLLPRETRLPPAQSPPAEPPSVPTPPARETPVTPTPGAAAQATGPRGGGRWLAAAAIFLLAIGGVLIGTQFAGSDATPSTATNESEQENDSSQDENDPDVAVTAPQDLVPFAVEVFAAPDQPQGVAFGSVTNSQGLTIVGASGGGGDVASQRPEYWTIGSGLQADHWPNFAEDPGQIETGQRSWDIGVIDRQTFLVVGDTTGAGGTDGIAWFGAQSGDFTRVSDESFTGDQADSLRAAAADGEEAFLVAGARTSGGVASPSVWQVTRSGNSWVASDWTVLNIGSDGEGALHDVAVTDDFAIAVGVEAVDGVDSAIMKIRRDGLWQDLIAPIPDAVLWGATISSDRIVAVGVQGEDADEQRPIAVVSNPQGLASLHILPVRGATGTARDVVTRADDTVVAVGIDRDGDDAGGAIWQLLPGDELPADRWTTRASGELSAIDGFVEFWSIDEFDDQLFVFGRTEDGEQRPAGAWTLDLS